MAGFVASLGQDVPIRPHFVAGDEFAIAMTRTVEERLGTERTHSISRTIQIKVMTTSADGTTLQWRPGAAQIKGVPERTDARMAATVLAATDHDFLLALDSLGQYRRTTNVAELTPSLERSLGAMRAKVPTLDDPALSAMPRITAGNVASAVGQDAEIFTGFYGMSSPVGVDVEMAAAFRMPGGEIPGVRRLRIVSATDESAEATMTFTLDQTALRKLIPGAAETPSFKVDLTETARYIFDRRVRLNRSGTMDRTALGGKDSRIERWQFSLISTPKR